jgi:GT2 family glycosyltransferase
MISLVVVNYWSAELAKRAIASARSASSVPLQVVIVDNTCDPEEAGRLAGAGDELIVSAMNRGYAGAINDARKKCAGDVIVICNPDVVFGPHSIDFLVESLQGNVAVAGPALYWDDAHEWLLPPNNVHTGMEKLSEVFASRSRSWARERDRRRIKSRIEFWSLDETTLVDTLSGAIMAVKSRAFDEAGGFDQRFFLYFEETDFLRRIRAARKDVAFVPAAKCRHLYNQSAGEVPHVAPGIYADSELRYLEKWNGPFAARTLKHFERAPFSQDAVRLDGPILLDRDGLLVEASPLSSFSTAAGHFPARGSVVVPTEIESSLRQSELYLRVVDPVTLRVLSAYVRHLPDGTVLPR